MAHYINAAPGVKGLIRKLPPRGDCHGDSVCHTMGQYPGDSADSKGAVLMGNGDVQPGPERGPVDRESEALWVRKFAALVPPHCRSVLEVGCGTGELGAAIKQRMRDLFYLGLESDAGLAEIALGRLDQVHAGDIDRFDWSRLAGLSFDCILFDGILARLTDPGRICAAAARLLTPGGSVVCSLPNVSHWSILSGLIAGKWEYSDAGAIAMDQIRFFTLAGCKDLLDACGLYMVQEDHFREEALVPAEFGPYLRKVNVDVGGFLERAKIRRFIFRAERIPKSRPSLSLAVPEPTGLRARESVAVIIPVFNKVELTRDCLISIAKHYPEGISPEVIVFDNASSDGTGAYLERAQSDFEWLKVIRSKVNLGFAGACNKGAQLADADVVVFLNNDTIVLPGWLEKMLERINDDSVGIVGSKLIYPDGRIQHAGIVFNDQAVPTHVHHLAGNGDAAVNRMMEYPAVTGACIMIKRPLFLELGMMDTEYPMYYEDVDLCFKVREKGLKVVYQPESMVIHLEGRSSDNFEAIVKHNEASRVIFRRKWEAFMLRGLAADPGFYVAGKEYPPR
jgi:GT2 family glycosyltransferase/SAM-dependent methyltransferase